jgi:hypothetical protein
MGLICGGWKGEKGFHTEDTENTRRAAEEGAGTLREAHLALSVALRVFSVISV